MKEEQSQVDASLATECAPPRKTSEFAVKSELSFVSFGRR
jgi:hypothetical protein